MSTTLTTTATFEFKTGILFPKVTPDVMPEEVVVTFVLPRERDTDNLAKKSDKPLEEWRRKALALEGTLDISQRPELEDPVAYVRNMRNLELEEMKQTYDVPH